MTNWGTYSIIVALLAMIFPFVFRAFEAAEISTCLLFPIAALLFGGLGVMIHLFSMLKTGSLNGSALLLLTSILSIIYGFSLSAIGVINAKYLLLTGVLLVAVWISVPNESKVD